MNFQLNPFPCVAIKLVSSNSNSNNITFVSLKTNNIFYKFPFISYAVLCGKWNAIRASIIRPLNSSKGLILFGFHNKNNCDLMTEMLCYIYLIRTGTNTVCATENSNNFLYFSGNLCLKSIFFVFSINLL